MDYKQILLDKKDGVATITLNRPKLMNPLSTVVALEVQDAIRDIEADDSINVVVLTGAGKNFSAGGDLTEQDNRNKSDDPHELGYFLEDVKDFFNALYYCSKPTIAMVKGYALAGGIEMILICDMAVVAEDATIGDQHINNALIGGLCTTIHLPRSIGFKKANELVYTGLWIDGKEAEKIGLVNYAVPEDKLEEETYKLAAKVASKSRYVLAESKALILQQREIPLPNALDHGLMALKYVLGNSADTAEAWAAFQEKRKPVYKGC